MIKVVSLGNRQKELLKSNLQKRSKQVEQLTRSQFSTPTTAYSIESNESISVINSSRYWK
jgi:hypothetical protein